MEPAPHEGSVKEYERHLRRGEAPCNDCRNARNAYRRAREAARRGPARELKPCGTEAAYHRHLYHGETPCDDCKEAHYAPKRKNWEEP